MVTSANRLRNKWLLTTACLVVLAIKTPLMAAEARPQSSPDSLAVARQVDELIARELDAAGVQPAPPTSDEDFLRRITFDLAGAGPTPHEVTLFGLDQNPDKRAKRIEQLLQADEFNANWARYWRDVIFTRATDQRSRLAQGAFETWMTEQLRQNRTWDEIASDLITATGDVREHGETALLFAHGGDPAEIASEASRIFLGIQIQCANCHDHPTDRWKREDFHQLAAFFPRVQVRPVRNAQPRSFEVVSFDSRGDRRPDFRENPERLINRFDRNRDGKISKAEVGEGRFAGLFGRMLERGDKNNDGALTAAEIKEIPPPMNAARGSAEYYMPDLKDPASKGTRIDPVFFINKQKVKTEQNDIDRRKSLARLTTAADNPWFARAYVNRIWAEMLGQGFYMPIDDMGPERKASFPDVLDALSEGFVASGYDVRWLFRTIANTQAYQRSIQMQSPADDQPAFAAATPTRLRADQLYDALAQVLGFGEPGKQLGDGERVMRRRRLSPRALFAELFAFDPSTPQEDIVGEVPQALFMMNSPIVNNAVRADRPGGLGRILKNFPKDEDAVKELYLLVLSRHPTQGEIKTCLDYVGEVGSRDEAFEDLMWGLINSAEFLSKR